MTIEQVEKAKFLGITLKGQLSWSSHIHKFVVKMGRGMFVRGVNVFLHRDSKQSSSSNVSDDGSREGKSNSNQVDSCC